MNRNKRRIRRRWRGRRWSGNGAGIVRRSTTDVANGHAHSIASESVQIQSEQHIANVAEVVGKSDDKHCNAGKAWHLAHKLDA